MIYLLIYGFVGFSLGVMSVRNLNKRLVRRAEYPSLMILVSILIWPLIVVRTAITRLDEWLRANL